MTADPTTSPPPDRPADRRAGAVVNVHSRVIGVAADVLGAELDRLGGPLDRLWPSPAWWPVRLGDPERRAEGSGPQVGDAGGHGRIRYAVSAYEPGRRIRLQFDPRIGLDGFHELTVEPLTVDGQDGAPAAASCRVTHVIRAHLSSPRMRLLWPLLVRHLHDALLEDLLDRAEYLGTGRVERRARWSPFVRFAHARMWPAPVPVDLPHSARQIRAAFEHPDLADAHAFGVRPGLPDTPGPWAEEVFGRGPRWVRALMAVRNAVVPLVGIARSSERVLDPMPGSSDDEVLLGADAGHLDVRVSFVVDEGRVVVSTVARAHNRRGRAYLAVIRRAHPVIVRRMLRHTSRRLALAAAGRSPAEVVSADGRSPSGAAPSGAGGRKGTAGDGSGGATP